MAQGIPQIEQMDLNNLRLLIQIMECGSLGRAQKKLGLPKSTLSRRLSQFEKQLNIKLVERELTGLTLTDAGQRLIAQSAPLIEELGQVEDLLAVYTKLHEVVYVFQFHWNLGSTLLARSSVNMP